jgi:hypothetical protein
VGAKASADLDRVRESFDVEVARSMARMEAADAVIQSIALARAGQVDQGKTLLVAAETEARASAKRLDDGSLVKQADLMKPLREALPSLVQRAQVTQAGAAPADYEADAPAAESTVKRAHDEATSTLSAH